MPSFPIEYKILCSTFYAKLYINRFLQFKTNSLKIGSSAPSTSLIYGRNLAKRPNGGSGKGNSCRLFVIRGKKYMHCRTEILSSHGNSNWNLKENKNKLIKQMSRRRCIGEMRNRVVWDRGVGSIFRLRGHQKCSPQIESRSRNLITKWKYKLEDILKLTSPPPAKTKNVLWAYTFKNLTRYWV